jgi:hypothetical protein
MDTGCGSDLGDDAMAQDIWIRVDPGRIFQHKIHRAQVDALQRQRRGMPAGTTDQDHGRWALVHNLIECFQTAHVRHLQIERDHIRTQGLH